MDYADFCERHDLWPASGATQGPFAKNDFSTLRAAKKMGMDVRQASETLIALCEADWICFNGTRLHRLLDGL
jgi:hypothetical protein